MTHRQQIREGLRQPPDCVWITATFGSTFDNPTPRTISLVWDAKLAAFLSESIRLVGKDTP